MYGRNGKDLQDGHCQGYLLEKLSRQVEDKSLEDILNRDQLSIRGYGIVRRCC